MTTALIDEIGAIEPPEQPADIDWGQNVLDAPDADAPRRSGLCACGCGQPLRPGAKRPYLRGHKTNPRNPDEAAEEAADKSTGPKRTYGPRQGKLKDDLLEPYVELAADLAVVAPTVSGVLIIRAEKTVDGMVDLASGHPRVLAALKKATKAGKGAALIETLLLVMVAVAVDTGRIPATHPILDRIGHSEIVKDEKGNPRKEGNKIIKERVTLRDIYNQMHPDGEEAIPDGPPPPPVGSVSFPMGPSEMGTGPLRPPVPMNNMWVEHGS